MPKCAKIQIHGCFWHYHLNCSRSHIPKDNSEYWKSKLYKTRVRDEKQFHELSLDGWQVMVIRNVPVVGVGRFELSGLIDFVSQWIVSDSGSTSIAGLASNTRS